MSYEQALLDVISSYMVDVHTALPGRIVSFDADKQTCTVQPCIQRKFKNQAEFVDLPVLQDVPVLFPGSGDFFITWDVKPDSYCLLVFCERSIAKWIEKGDLQPPTSYRKHDLSDAIAFVGLNPLPDKLSPVDADAIVIRNRANSSFIKLDSSGTVNINDNFTVDP